MIMPAWPSDPTLPQKVLAGTYTESIPDQTIRTQNSIGPDKIRRRTTAAPTPWQGVMLMSKTQVASLLTFIQTTLSGGVLTIENWAHQRTGSLVDHRFRSMPDIQHAGCNQNDSGDDVYRVTLDMEILP